MNPMYLVSAVIIVLVVLVSLLLLLLQVADLQRQHVKDIARHDDELKELRLKLIEHIRREALYTLKSIEREKLIRHISRESDDGE